MRTIELTLKGTILAKQSVRQGKFKSDKIFYQPKKFKDKAESYNLQIKFQLPSKFEMFTKEVIVDKIVYTFAVKDKQKWGKPKTTRPDVHDNLSKLPFDCMNGLVFTDDSLVWRLAEVEKRYGEHSSIYIKLKGE